MKATSGRGVLGLAALGCTILGVAAAPAATARHVARARGGKVVARVPIPAGTGGFAVGQGAVWAVSDAVPTLTRIDPGTNKVAASIEITPAKVCPAEPPGCGEAAAGDGAVWVTHVMDDTVSRIDPQTNAISATIKVGSRPAAVAITHGAVWVANEGDPSVSRVDPATNHVVATIPLARHAFATDRMAVTAARNAVWVSLETRDAVLRIDPSTNKVVAAIKLSWIHSGQPCGFLAAAGQTVWAAGAHCASSSGYGVVTRLDAITNKPTKIVQGLRAPIGLALGFGSLWVADLDAKTIDRIDPRTGRIVARLRVGGLPIRLGIGFGSLWVRDDGGRVLRIEPAPAKAG